LRRSDIISGIVLALFGIVTIFVIIPSGISVSEEYGLSPRIFPLTVMWLGTLVALILVVQRLREAPVETDEPPMHTKNWIFIAAMSAYLAATYFAIDVVGFKVVGPVSVAVLMVMMGELRHPVRLVLVSLTLPLIVYYTFDRVFIIQLP
jgi:Tripartite tricarboxylate transporter TctB family